MRWKVRFFTHVHFKVVDEVTIIFSKNAEFGNLESENSVFDTSMQKTVKLLTNKSEFFFKFNAKKTTIQGMLHILFNHQDFEENQEISKFRINSRYFAKM